MKKGLTIIFAALLIVSLAACGNSSSGNIQKPSDISTNNPGSEESKETKIENDEEQKESIVTTVEKR